MTRLTGYEKTPLKIEGVITDARTGAVVPGSTVTSCTVKLMDLETGNKDTSPIVGVINARYWDDILDEVTISEAGEFEWETSADDMPIITQRRQIERHLCTLHFTWTSGSPEADGEFYAQFEIDVYNMGGVETL